MSVRKYRPKTRRAAGRQESRNRRQERWLSNVNIVARLKILQRGYIRNYEGIYDMRRPSPKYYNVPVMHFHYVPGVARWQWPGDGRPAW